MDVALFSEKPKKVSIIMRLLALLAILISVPLNWFSPNRIEKIFTRITKNKPSASEKEVLEIRDAVCTVSRRCRSQEGCLRRSIAVVVAAWLKRRSASWNTGFALEPFRAHAWVEVKGIPIGEPDEISLYTKVISVAAHSEEKPKKKIKSAPEQAQEDKGKSEQRKSNLRELFALANGYKLELFLVVILGIICACLTLLQPNLVADLVQQYSSGFVVNSTLILLVIVLAVSMILTTIQYYLLQKIGEGVVFEARSSLISHLLKLPIIEYDKRSVGDLISRVSGDTSRLRMALIQGTIAFTSGSFIVVGAAIGLALKDLVLFLTALFCISLAFIGIFMMSNLIQKSSFRVQQELGKLSGMIERDLHAIRTIRSTNATLAEENKIKLQAEYLRNLGIRLAKIQSLMTPISNMSLQICGLIVLGFGGYRVSIGSMSLADLIAFALLLFIMIGPLTQIFGAFSGVGESLGAFSRIKELLDLDLETSKDDNSAKTSYPHSSNEDGMVVFHKVNFGYNKLDFGKDIISQNDNLILKEIDLQAEIGKRTAIVGSSGAGKSTILQLIERFYDPDSGHIYVNGKDCRSYSREDLRKFITYVEQNAPIIAGSLRENLLLGNPTVTEEKCYNVLKEVNLSYLIERSPEKLDMIIGESGTTLSGGERQRLAMARSLLSDAKIVLLDELTSNLDSLNEIGMKKAIDKMRENKTVIVVAHRLSTIVDSDMIYVLEHGRIIGSGSHNELLERVPLYRKLAKEQFLDKVI